MTSSLDIPRYSREQFIIMMGVRLENSGVPIRMINSVIGDLRRGALGGARRTEVTMDMLDLTIAERSEFRRHFFGGD